MKSSSLGGPQWEGSGCLAIFLRDLDIVDELPLAFQFSLGISFLPLSQVLLDWTEAIWENP